MPETPGYRPTDPLFEISQRGKANMGSNQAKDVNSPEHPSMIGGHLKYIQGAVSSALGYETGEQTKKEAVSEMKQANEQNTSAPTQSNILGTIENAAGSLLGCEGMEQEGQSRKNTQENTKGPNI